MKSNDKQLVWVAPEFKKKIKLEATKEGLSILDYTRKISKDFDCSQKIKPKKIKGGFFDDFNF